MAKFLLKNDPFLQREKLKYENPLPSREYISSCMAQIGHPVDLAELVKVFGLKTEERQEALGFRLSAMARDGQIVNNRRGKFFVVDKSSLVRGTVISHREGFGFLVPEDGGKDVFLPPPQMRTLFHQDRILVQVLNPNKKGRLEGVVIEILERKVKQVVGRYFIEGGIGFVTPINKRINQDIIVSKADAKKAKSGQLVVAIIVDYPTKRHQAIGKIAEILGEHVGHGLATEIATKSYGLPNIWPDAVLAEIKTISKKIAPKVIQQRKDLRNLPLVTIDGEDAKDFDDAVYCKKNNDGSWVLYVAIADVSYYVKPKTELDQEALSRGNSVYFPNKVIPMLPEILANELCSLQPNVERLCMVCEMQINKQGKVGHYQFYEAVMRSHARLTYNGAFTTLTEDKKAKEYPLLRELHNLYEALNKQRIIRGAMSLETIETKIIFDEEQKIKKIQPTTRNVMHQIIEECMLAANVCAAKLLLKHKIPSLYRIHEGPDPEKLTTLRNFLHGLGLALHGGDEPKPIDYANLAESIRGRKDEHVIQKLLLRSLRQAVYDEENIGHFGLAYEAYGHFTSPIRRYPDLLTHRALKHLLAGGNAMDFYYDSNSIHNFGEHCSMTERRADEATYDAIDWLKCEYMQNKLGKVFSGIISSVTNFGLFVELKDIYIEGLVHITSLPNDYYTFNEAKYCLIGNRSGKKYCLGDSLKVLIAKVDIDNRQIDFVLP
jgi:ribonuclease R